MTTPPDIQGFAGGLMVFFSIITIITTLIITTTPKIIVITPSIDSVIHDASTC